MPKADTKPKVEDKKPVPNTNNNIDSTRSLGLISKVDIKPK